MTENILELPCKDEEIKKLAAAYTEPVKKLLADFEAQAAKNADERDNALVAKIEKQWDEKHEAFRKEAEKITRKFDVPGADGGDDGRRKGEMYNTARVARANYQKDWSGAPFEKEVTMELHKNMGTDPDGSLGVILPEFKSTSIIDKLRAQQVLVQLGARYITSPKGNPMKLPRLKTDATAAWIGEGVSITASDLVMNQITLSPRKLAAFGVLNNELINDAPGVAEQMVETSFVNQLQLGLDLAGLNGTGNGQPNGVINLASGTYDCSDNATWYTNLKGLVNQVMRTNAAVGKLGFAMHPDVMFYLETGAGGTGDPEVARRLLTSGTEQNLVGYKWATTTQLPATGTGAIVFGNWDSLLIANFSTIAIKGSDVAGDALQTDTFKVRGLLRADCNVEHPESFAVGTGVVEP